MAQLRQLRGVAVPLHAQERQGRRLIQVCTGEIHADLRRYESCGAQETNERSGGPPGLQEGPKKALPDGTRYEYDPILKRTVEVTPSGERFPVTLVDGKLQRDSQKADKRNGVLRRSPTPSGDTIPISSPKCVPDSSKTGGTNEGER